MWDEYDYDGNGMLDKAECKDFMDELATHIKPENAQNYNKDDFDYLFTKFDTDQNGYIDKSEMVIFIK